jgi:glycine oxidase
MSEHRRRTSGKAGTGRPGARAPDRADVAVVGAGIIGTAVAWRLAELGMSVALIDAGSPAGRPMAAEVAAGMLAPVGEVHYGEEALLALNLAAAARWPLFAAELVARTSELDSLLGGAGIGFSEAGTLVVALDASDARWLQELHAYQRELGLDARWLSGSEARALEPLVAPEARAGLLAPGDHQVDPRRVVACLRLVADAAGVTRWPGVALAVEHAGGRVEGVVVAPLDAGGTPGKPAGRRVEEAPYGEELIVLRARVVVVAAGAWSGELLEPLVPANQAPRVRPVKGQILRLAAGAHKTSLVVSRPARVVRAVVQGSKVYVVPRAEGEVVLGATVEEQGFDTTPTAGALYELLRDGVRSVPALRELALVEHGVGLRPGSYDNLPYVGALDVPGTPDGVVVATGHYRNGVLHAPITAEAVARIVQGLEPPMELVACAPGRHAPGPSRPSAPRGDPQHAPTCRSPDAHHPDQRTQVAAATPERRP